MRIVSLKRSLLLAGILFLPTAAMAQTAPPPPPVTGYMIQIRQGAAAILTQPTDVEKEWTCGLGKVAPALAPLVDPIKFRIDDPADPTAFDCETSQPAFFRQLAAGSNYTGWVAPMSTEVVGVGEYVMGIPPFSVKEKYGPFAPVTGVRLLK